LDHPKRGLIRAGCRRRTAVDIPAVPQETTMTTTEPTRDAVLHVLADDIRVLTTPGATGGMFELFEVDGPELSGPPPHAHPWSESYYVLDGEVAVDVDGTEYILDPGDSVTAAAGALHTYQIRSARARVVIATSGTAASKFFADLSSHVAPGHPTPETLPRIVEIAKRNGLTSPLFP
jgi:quercetin dioxygenase-like cupin family protein